MRELMFDETIEPHNRERFWQAIHDGFARLRADPDAWQEYESGAALWDSASGDGLEDEEPYFIDQSSLPSQSG